MNVRRWACFVERCRLIVCFSICASAVVWAQSLLAQIAPPPDAEFVEARLQNVVVLPPRAVEFDIVLARFPSSALGEVAALRRWANGTFILRAENLPLAGAMLSLDSTDIQALEQFSLGASALQPERKGYEFRLVVAPEREYIAVVVLGPDSANVAQIITEGAPFLVGRFRLTCRSAIPNPALARLKWTPETARYQANAFKAEGALRAFGALYERNDNVETPTRYAAEPPSVEEAPELVARGFSAEYIGDKRALLRWNTLRERVGRRTNVGFLLLRSKERARGVETPTNNSPRAFDTVATFAGAGSGALRLRGAATGAEYQYIDSALERGYRYFYRLAALDATPRAAQEFSARIEADDGEIVVPNAILGAAEAFPNPFAESPTVRYTLLDRADVAIHLYDALGRLLHSEEIARAQARGEYEYRVGQLVLPNHIVVFATLSAVPQDDDAVERSRVTFKLQKQR